MRRLISISFAFVLILAACGGGGGGGGGSGALPVSASTVSGLSTGYLIDSAVEGVTYTVTTKDGKTITGVTDASEHSNMSMAKK